MSLADWRAFAAEDGLPAYYGDHLADVAQRVRERAAKGRDAFWFFTDPHVPSNHKMSGRVLAKLIAETGVRKVVCGGDIPEAFGGRASVERSMAEFRTLWIDPIEAAGGRFYLAKGNHDFTIRESMKSQNGFTVDGRTAAAYILGTSAAKGVTKNDADPECAYYYFDEPAAKLRYVVIDTTDSISPTRKYWGVENGVHPRQLDWLRETIETSPNPCVVLSHQSFERPTNGAGVQNKDAVQAIFNAANAKCPGKVRLVMNGHLHTDYLRLLDNILYWDVNSANYAWFDKTHTCYPADYVKTHRLANHNLGWARPLSAILTLTREGGVKIDGAKADWLYGVTPQQANLARFDANGRFFTPTIQSANFKFVYD